ncbi:MAG: glucose-1-phosphate adenylyltransferase subunit GlgD [Oscillospiraceae bacterium]|nr:glucose-1-phosphate adenylyltransferase subunit GlgD [Oscillospiraceae bacterium]
MVVNYNVLGLIFASMHDTSIAELTKQRTMGSILFGGRYRLIDFPLSNMVNSGITEIGVITKSNYGSLLDHIGSGREWDLSRKKGGLHLLPPYSQDGGIYRGRLDALSNVWSFIEHSPANYVILSDCDMVTTIDFNPVLEQHESSGADITVVYGRGLYNAENNHSTNILELDGIRVKDVLVDPQFSGECNMSLGMFVMSKKFLKKIVFEAVSRNQYSLIRDVLQSKKNEYIICGYEHKDYFSKIDTLLNYYNANLELLQTSNRNALFKKDFPIYTKIGDNGPTKYGLESNIKNSLIADGCIIEGTVENCVLFRGVKIGKDTVVKNSIILQGTEIGNNCQIASVITDKNVKISDTKVLTGSETCPLYIGKNAQI